MRQPPGAGLLRFSLATIFPLKNITGRSARGRFLNWRSAMAFDKTFVSRDFARSDARDRVVPRNALIWAFGIRVGALLLLTGLLLISHAFK
jgi:hypothetical protein